MDLHGTTGLIFIDPDVDQLSSFNIIIATIYATKEMAKNHIKNAWNWVGYD